VVQNRKKCSNQQKVKRIVKVTEERYVPFSKLLYLVETVMLCKSAEPYLPEDKNQMKGIR